MSESTVPHSNQLETEAPFSARQLIRTLRKSWPMVVAITAAVSLFATFYTLGQTRIYRASATVVIDPNPPKPLGKDVQNLVDMGTGAYWSNKEYYETQFKIIQSRRVPEDVVRTLGLHHDAGFLQNLPPEAKAPPTHVPVETRAAMLRGRTQVDPIKNSRLVMVSLEDADPARAQRVLSALVDAYVEQNVDEVIASTNSAAEWLRGQLDKLKVELETSERALHGYKMDNTILSLSIDDQSNMPREAKKQLNNAPPQVPPHQPTIPPP